MKLLIFSKEKNNEGKTTCNRDSPVAGATQGNDHLNENRYKKSPEFTLRVWRNR